jgi:hypothetical protein
MKLGAPSEQSITLVREFANASTDVDLVAFVLLPVEIRVRQNNVQGPHGSAAMYAEAKPHDGNALCGALGIKARTNVALWTGEAPETGGTKQDALRHSLWNMLSAAAIGRDHTIAITTANEHTGRMDQAAFARNTTMDLFNDGKGADEGAALYQPGGTLVDTLVGFNHMNGISDNPGLRAWTPPGNNVTNHHHMIRKSDQTTIYPRQ